MSEANSSWTHLFRSRRERQWIWVVLACYAGTLIIMGVHHEPWFDEAQGWLLARDSGLMDLLWHRLRYEGSPGLWHLLLMIPAHLGLPYASIQILAGISALIAVYLVLRYAPFPIWIRVLLPFSFYLGYQYAVVARSYVLMPPLLFGVAILFRRRFERPVAYFLLLALLANVSAHGIILALSFALLHFADFLKRRPDLSPSDSRTVWMTYVSFGLVMLLLVAVLWPPVDLKVFTGDRTRDWLRAISWPFTDSVFLSLIILLATVYLLKKRNALLPFLIPFGGIALLFAKVFRYTHDGLLFLVWLTAIWIALDRQDDEEDSVPWQQNTRVQILGLVVIVLVFQVVWLGMTVRQDFRYNYSASRETADYLKTCGLANKRVYGWGFGVMSILPYFDRNIFYNYNHGKKPCFWQWSKENTWNHMVGTRRTDYSVIIQQILEDKPDIVVIGIKNRAQGQFPVQLSKHPEYRLVHFFRGKLWFKTMSNPEIEDYCIFLRQSR